jgi:hypothetical protein
MTASPTAANDYVVSLTVNGVLQSGNTFAVANMDKNLEVLAVFGTEVGDETQFRAALAGNGPVIRLPENGVITLDAVVEINRSITIEGNGAVIMPSVGKEIQLLIFGGRSDMTVVIRRIHFKDGAGRYGGAIRNNNTGSLRLESCIFSDNKPTITTTSYGGAIAATGTLTVLGCTFCDNEVESTAVNANQSSTGKGGAVVVTDGTFIFGGNLFYGNSAQFGEDVVRLPLETTTSTLLGYNVSDKPNGTSAAGSGWNFLATDVQLTDVTFDSAFKPSSATGLPVIPSLPADFPATYFDGTPRGTNSTPGAMPRN